MRKNYIRQILNHNVEKFSLIVRDDIYIFLSIEIIIQVNKNVILEINSMSDMKKIRGELK